MMYKVLKFQGFYASGFSGTSVRARSGGCSLPSGSVSFAPAELDPAGKRTQGFRPGLYSCAASRLRSG
jgi:hypothetical protein